MDQLSGAGSQLTVTLELGGVLIAAIVSAIVWVIMHGRAANVTSRDKRRRPEGDKMDEP